MLYANTSKNQLQPKSMPYQKYGIDSSRLQMLENNTPLFIVEQLCAIENVANNYLINDI